MRLRSALSECDYGFKRKPARALHKHKSFNKIRNSFFGVAFLYCIEYCVVGIVYNLRRAYHCVDFRFIFNNLVHRNTSRYAQIIWRIQRCEPRVSR
jgi:hypothetical protein